MIESSVPMSAPDDPPSGGMLFAVRVAQLCGAGPLLCGVGSFVGFLATDDDTFAMAGFATIFVGVLSVAIGFLTLIGIWIANRRSASPARIPWGSTTGLLLVNFPAAFFLFIAGSVLYGSHRVVLRNETGVPAHNVVIDGTERPEGFGTLDDGDSASRWFAAQSDMDSVGYLELSATIEGERHRWAVDSYINGDGQRYRVTLEPEGSIRIAEGDREYRIHASGEHEWIVKPRGHFEFDATGSDRKADPADPQPWDGYPEGSEPWDGGPGNEKPWKDR